MAATENIKLPGFGEYSKIIKYLAENCDDFKEKFGNVVLENIVVGSGSFGRVYQMQSSRYKGIALAVKFSDPLSPVYKYGKNLALEDMQVYIEKFEAELNREANINIELQSHEHKNVVTAYGVYRLDRMKSAEILGAKFERKFYILIMPFYKYTLEKYIESKQGEITEKEVLSIVEQLAQGVCHLHSLTADDQRLIHRDIKPQNIFVDACDSSYRILIGDFSCAKWAPLYGGSIFNSIELASADPFRHPSMDPDLNKASIKTDIYSMAMVLFFLVLINQNNFSDYNNVYSTLAEAKTLIDMPDFTKYKPQNCDVRLWEVIRRGVGNVFPYESAEEFLEAVGDVQEYKNYYSSEKRNPIDCTAPDSKTMATKFSKTESANCKHAFKLIACIALAGTVMGTSYAILRNSIHTDNSIGSLEVQSSTPASNEAAFSNSINGNSEQNSVAFESLSNSTEPGSNSISSRENLNASESRSSSLSGGSGSSSTSGTSTGLSTSSLEPASQETASTPSTSDTSFPIISPYVPMETGVSIDVQNFPDEVFRNYISANCDTNGNGVLSSDEINQTVWMQVDDMGISSLKGLEYFTNLQELDCWNNNLTSLDVSNNVMLHGLHCQKNNLVSLNLTYNSNLDNVSCFGNNLTSLDVSKCPKLSQLSCEDNMLTSLDVSHNSELGELLCCNNSLTNLDVSHNSKLTMLYCQGNHIANLNFANNPSLQDVHCDEDTTVSYS